MMKLTRSIFLLAILPTNQIHAAGAPDALKGKSVILSWSETRQQRHVGELPFTYLTLRITWSATGTLDHSAKTLRKVGQLIGSPLRAFVSGVPRPSSG
jgi:hypothetical protein